MKITHLIYLAQSSTESNPIVCIDTPIQAITLILTTIGGGGGFLAVWFKTFWDVERIRSIAELQGEIKSLQTERSHLNIDIEEYKAEIASKNEQISKLQSEVNRLQEVCHSGFSTQLTDLQERYKELQAKYNRAKIIIENARKKQQ